MFKKSSVLLFSGTFLLCLFSFFSAFPQNPGEVNSVFLFTYHCMLDTGEYGPYTSMRESSDNCYYNLWLSLLVAGYGGAGMFLTVHSLKSIRKKSPEMFKKMAVQLFSGIFLLCLFSVFSSIPQLQGDVNTVHLVTYHCMLETVGNSQSLADSVVEAAEECYFDPRLSLLVIGYGATGIFLIVYSVRRIKKSIK